MPSCRHVRRQHEGFILIVLPSGFAHHPYAQNAFTEQFTSALREISLLNNDLVQLPPNLTSLQASFRAKNSFSHIQRLHNMIYAYGATVIEIVRRKEFGKVFPIPTTA